MNILPKKRWHVRTKENIARVRRDEAKAAEEEKAIKARVQKAETEARTNFLRDQARQRYDGRQVADGKDEGAKEATTSEAPLEHVNFFADIEDGKTDYSKPNADHEIEKKQEQEKYEKQIGYLTYLGQDTNEATGNKSWYNELPKRLSETEKYEEAGIKTKLLNDPINDIRKYMKIMGSTLPSTSSPNFKREKLKTTDSVKRKRDSSDLESCTRDGDRKRYKKHKSKKSKKHKRSKTEEPTPKPSVDLEKLRAERLRRENAEKLKTKMLLAKLNGDPIEPAVKEVPKPIIQQKYNSQFNPEIARQNADRLYRR
ncbi:leukocyte receptor cluster member 1 homolog [Neodiprion lecontei]|uniref:Leukocyte receptor cluster member 1 homolog n=1 Tax=Neodiprion lecontei TaxID=441921 RepID=A0A6J0BM69_NEOLC|nr:leukocyte receptor cluster member 1 homolog [Neodiprion lecontei]